MDYIRSPSRYLEYLKHPNALYYYFNKSIRSPRLRGIFFHLVRSFVPKGNVALKEQARLTAIERDGLTTWEQFADAATVERIRNFLSGKPVYDSRDLLKTPRNLSDFAGTHTLKLKYFYDDLVESEDIAKIANDERVLSLVTAYFGCKPTINIMEVWWTRAGQQSSNMLFQDDMYHRDVEDFKFIKLFVYLSDVRPENGAHCFIRGSHRFAGLTERKPLSEEKAEQAFAPADRLVLAGKAGYGFLEDTWGLHRSLPATSGERLLLSITYGLTALNPQSPPKPLAENRFRLDPYINRVYYRNAA